MNSLVVLLVLFIGYVFAQSIDVTKVPNVCDNRDGVVKSINTQQIDCAFPKYGNITTMSLQELCCSQLELICWAEQVSRQNCEMTSDWRKHLDDSKEKQTKKCEADQVLKPEEFCQTLQTKNVTVPKCQACNKEVLATIKDWIAKVTGDKMSASIRTSGQWLALLSILFIILYFP